ncbi:hypothetical protein D049_0792B, partial [Vibrio parahaemolyticus VPTS-2010]
VKLNLLYWILNKLSERRVARAEIINSKSITQFRKLIKQCRALLFRGKRLGNF